MVGPHRVCVCVYAGSCEGHCHNQGTCLQTADGTKLCRCPPQYTGATCDIDKCHYCRDGECIPGSSFGSAGDFSCR